MATSFGPFSSRQVASAILLAMLLSLAVLRLQGFRQSLRDLVRAALPLCTWALTVLIYYVAVVSVLYYLQIWHVGLAVPTTIWVLTAGLATVFKNIDGKWRQVNLRVQVVFSIALGWLVSLYTFPLLVEMVYQIVAATVTVMQVVVARAAIGSRFSSNVLWLTSMLLLALALIPPIDGLIRQPFDPVYVESMLLPLVGFVSLMPISYMLSLSVLYRDIHRRLSRDVRSQKARRYALLRTIVHFHVRHRALHRFRTAAAGDLFSVQTRQDVDRAFERHAGVGKWSCWFRRKPRSRRTITINPLSMGVSQLPKRIVVGTTIETDGPSEAGFPGFASLSVGEPPYEERIANHRKIMGPTRYRIVDECEGAVVTEFNTQFCLPWRIVE